ncbi:MAG: ABC transporter substrate-binding protein [Bacillota bacterium]
MKKIVLMVLAGLALLVVFLLNVPKPVPDQIVIGVLTANETRLKKLPGLKDGLKKYGFREGENVQFVILNAEDERERLVPLARQLIQKRPDAIIAMGGVEADVLKGLTLENRVPVVFAGVALPSERGLIDSYRFPGGNLTGVDNLQSELAGKRLEFLKLLVPGVSRVLILYDPQVPSGKPSLNYLGSSAAKLGVKLFEAPVQTREEVRVILENAKENKYDAILLLPSFVWENSPFICSYGLDYGIPVAGLYEDEADRGFLVSYGPSYYNQGYQASSLVAKVLQGQDPSQIPVEKAYQLELAVNLKVAKKLGLSLSPEALRLADIIISD